MMQQKNQTKLRINNTQVADAQEINVVMPMYNLIEYSADYSKTSVSSWQYYRDDPNDPLKNSESFKTKLKITGKTPADGNITDVGIVLPLKYLSKFWRTLEIPLIIVIWSTTCVIKIQQV